MDTTTRLGTFEEMGSFEAFGPPTGEPISDLPHPLPGELPHGAGDPIAFIESLPPATRLIELAPGLEARSGAINPALIPTSCTAAIMKNAKTWETLREVRVGDMLSWQNVGVRRAARIVAFVRDLDAMAPYVVEQTSVDAQALHDLRLLAAWAVAMGRSTGVGAALGAAALPEAPPEVSAALASLESVSLEGLTTSELVARFDPIAAARELLSEFEGRQREVLERVLAKGLRPVPTLEEIGAVWGVSRERVRQVEVKVRENLARHLESQRYAVVRRHADQLAELVGAVIHVSELPAEMTPSSTNDLTDELFATLVGPYVLKDGWMVREDVGGSIASLLKDAYDSSVVGFAAPIDAVVDALEAVGMSTAAARRIVVETSGWNVVDDHVMRWTALIDRVLGVMQVIGRPMTFAELHEKASNGGGDGTLRNLLSVSPEIKRIRADQWALTSWGGEEYRSILNHMEEELSTGAMPLSELATRLHERFDIVKNSVQMYATMHPRFITAAGVVRLRGEDEAYVPTASLELSAGCFVVDGAWSSVVTVDYDLLRGSGRQMPEAFAVHLGLQPGSKGALDCGDRELKVSWGMSPTFGSLRWVAEREGLVDGDLLFVRRSTPSSLDFRFVRADDLTTADQHEVLRRRIGAAESSQPIERVLADALGLGGASIASAAQLRTRLIARGEHQLAELLSGSADSLPG